MERFMLIERPARVLYLIIIASFLMKFAFLTTLYLNNPEKYSNDFKPDNYFGIPYFYDSGSYFPTALNFLETGTYGVEPGDPAKQLKPHLRPPGYPMFIAAVYSIFGKNNFAVIAAQALLTCGTIFAVYKIAALLWGAMAGLFAALLAALDPVSFFFSQVIMSETIYGFFLILTVGFGVLLIMEKKYKWAALCGTCMSLAIFMRPVGYYLIFPIAIGFMVHYKISGKTIREAVSIFLITLAPWIILCGGWQARNYAVTGYSDFVDRDNLTQNLFQQAASGTVAIRDGIRHDEAYLKLLNSLPPESASWPLEKLDAYKKEMAFSILKKHPFLYVQMSLNAMRIMLTDRGELFYLAALRFIPWAMADNPVKDLFKMNPVSYIHKWFGENFIILAAFVGSAFYLYILLYLPFLYSAARSVFVDNKTGLVLHIFVMGILLYHFLVLGMVPGADSRYRAPLMPIFTLYAGYGWTLVVTWFQNRGERRALSH